MKTYTRIGVIALIVIVIVIIFAITRAHTPPAGLGTSEPTNTVSYACNAEKTITAVYYDGKSSAPAAPGQPPTPAGSVALTLSDGRTFNLPQTISADGTRYANADESFVFWGKGNGALVLENNQEKSYIGCIAVMKDPGGLTQIYQNSGDGFSIRYPADLTVDEQYVYQNLGPGKDIHGVKFTIPVTLASGTNLSADSYVSVEEIPQATSCDATLFLEKGVKSQTLTDGDTSYSLASSTGAGAGNRYEETVYAVPGTNPCVAVRYFIHYGVIQNYPEGTVNEFDRQSLVNQFDSIRRTLTIVQ